MADPRVTLSPEHQAIKRASRALVRAAGGVEAAALVTRVGKSQLSEYGRPESPSFMPVDVIADLEAITHGTPDHPAVTRHVARAMGYTLVRLPHREVPSTAALSSALVDCIREAGELHAAMAEALGDGRVDRAEAAQVKVMAIEAAEAGMALVAMLDRILEGE